jgi:hypothetical protein
MTPDIVDQIVKRKLLGHNLSGEVEGISSQEVSKLASRIKREDIGPEGVRQIALDAENYFLKLIKNAYPTHLDMYTRIKDGTATDDERETWQSISIEIGEQDLKEKFIEERLEPTQEDSLRTLETILGRKLNERREKFEEKFDPLRVRMFLDLESRANEILYPRDFQKVIFNGDTPTVLHYFCLRYSHDDGNFGVIGDLEEFSFRDLQGDTQSRNGASKKFQLDTIQGLESLYGSLVDQKVIVADSDLDKFEHITGEHEDTVRRYIQSVRDYLGGEIPVEGARSFFLDRGLNKSDQERLAKDIANGNSDSELQCLFLNNLETNNKKIKRSLNWGDSANLIYTATGLARSILEGMALSNPGEDYLVSIFDKSAVIGRQFNMRSGKRIPFIAFPRMPNNQDGFLYA